jgi:hypothetical protein
LKEISKEDHLLILNRLPGIKNLRQSGGLREIHDFASPPRGGFAISRHSRDYQGNPCLLVYNNHYPNSIGFLVELQGVEPYRRSHELFGLVQRLLVKIHKEEMTMKTLFVLVLVSGLLLMAGCQPAAISAGNPTSNPSESVAQTTATLIDDIVQTPSPESVTENKGIAVPLKTMTPDTNAQRLVQLAKESLARDVQLSTEAIQVSAVADVVWPDTSLGCPQPGLAYAQVITPGYIIVLEVAGTTYRYHADDSATVLLCQEGGLPEFIVTPGEIQDGKPWMPVP